MNSKALHKHATPLLILSVGLFIASLAGLSQLIQVGSGSDVSFSQLLNERLFDVKPAGNGLVHVSRYQSATAALPKPDTTHSALSQTTNVGKSTTLDITLSSLAQPNSQHQPATVH